MTGGRGPCGECGKRRILNVEITTSAGFIEFVCEPCLFELVRVRTEAAAKKVTETKMTETTKTATGISVEWKKTKRSAGQGYRACTSWSAEIGEVIAVVMDDKSFIVGTRDGSAMVTGAGTTLDNALYAAACETVRMAANGGAS